MQQMVKDQDHHPERQVYHPIPPQNKEMAQGDSF
jgi:hypothetical protein